MQGDAHIQTTDTLILLSVTQDTVQGDAHIQTTDTLILLSVTQDTVQGDAHIQTTDTLILLSVTQDTVQGDALSVASPPPHRHPSPPSAGFKGPKRRSQYSYGPPHFVFSFFLLLKANNNHHVSTSPKMTVTSFKISKSKYQFFEVLVFALFCFGFP